MSDLIPIPPLPAPPAIQLFANGELAHVNSALQRRIDEHKARFGAFWRTYDYTPDDILVNFGSNALVWLQAASESVDHINRLAELDGKTIQFVNTHLGLNAREKLLQIHALLGQDWLEGRTGTDPVVLCGDFNADPDKIMSGKFNKIVPYSHRPYGRIYAY